MQLLDLTHNRDADPELIKQDDATVSDIERLDPRLERPADRRNLFLSNKLRRALIRLAASGTTLITQACAHDLIRCAVIEGEPSLLHRPGQSGSPIWSAAEPRGAVA